MAARKTRRLAGRAHGGVAFAPPCRWRRNEGLPVNACLLCEVPQVVAAGVHAAADAAAADSAASAVVAAIIAAAVYSPARGADGRSGRGRDDEGGLLRVAYPGSGTASFSLDAPSGRRGRNMRAPSRPPRRRESEALERHHRSASRVWDGGSGLPPAKGACTTRTRGVMSVGRVELAGCQLFGGDRVTTRYTLYEHQN